MTFHTTTYESLSAREHGNTAGRVGAVSALTLPGVGWSSVNVTSNAIQDPLIPFSGFTVPPIQSLDFETVTNDASVTSLGRYCGIGSDRVSLDGASLDNNSPFLVADAPASSSGGRIAPDIRIRTGGAVQTALNALPGTTTNLNVCANVAYQSESYLGLTHFCDFQEQPPNTATEGSNRLTELLRLFNNASESYAVGFDSASNPIVANQCGFAAIDPGGVVYVRPEDIGPNPDQIPNAVTDNTPDAFRRHPSVFYPSGRTSYVRSLVRQKTDLIPVSEGSNGNPIRIIQVTAPITFSRWLVLVDGVPCLVNVPHPEGSDYRRPIDIWNNVILPIRNTGGALQADTAFGNYNTTYNTGQAVISRLAYADYWRCLRISGDRFVQTGGGIGVA